MKQQRLEYHAPDNALTEEFLRIVRDPQLAGYLGRLTALSDDEFRTIIALAQVADKRVVQGRAAIRHESDNLLQLRMDSVSDASVSPLRPQGKRSSFKRPPSQCPDGPVK